VLNSAKVEADSLLYLNDPILLADRLLPLMQTKVGFWTREEFTNDQLRLVCDAFSDIMRKKGSRSGLVEAVEVYIRTIGVGTTFDILITNKDTAGNDIYNIDVGINCQYKNPALLQELLSYIVPTGYTFNVYFYDGIELGYEEDGRTPDPVVQYSDFVQVAAAENFTSSLIRSSYYSSKSGEWQVCGAEVVTIDPSSDNLTQIQSIDMTAIANGDDNE